MPKIINNTRQAIHLPRMHRDGRAPYVEDLNGAKVPNTSEAWGGGVMVPAAKLIEGTQRLSPGELDVPGWYLDQLIQEKGWRKRFERGGGFEVGDGRGPLPAQDAKKDARIAELEAKLADRSADASAREGALRARVAELEAKLADRSADGADTKTSKKTEKAEKTEPDPKESKTEPKK